MAIKPQSTTPTTASELRELAEARLQQKQIAIQDLSTAADVMIRMIHEMEVYQIELEMQQEALTQSRDELVQSKKQLPIVWNAIQNFMTLHRSAISPLHLTGGYLKRT